MTWLSVLSTGELVLVELGDLYIHRIVRSKLSVLVTEQTKAAVENPPMDCTMMSTGSILNIGTENRKEERRRGGGG